MTVKRTFARRIKASLKASMKASLAHLAAVLLTALVAITPAQASGLIRDAEIEALLREYTDPILVAAGLQPDAVSIYIVNDPSLNAFVVGGKNIFIHTGLIVQAERPVELIGVIAHETGHISGAHLARRSEGAKAASLPMILGLGVGIIAAVAGAPELGMAAIAGGQQVAFTEMMAYSRVQESAADQAAVTFLDRTEQSSDGVLSFFEKFRYTEVLGSQSRYVPPYWRSHPMSADRIAALQNRVETSQHFGKPDSPESLHRFSMMQGKLRGFIDKPYATFRRYPDTDTSSEARYARAIALYRQVKVDEALAEVDALIAEEPKNPYFHELRGQILFETGQVSNAIPHHARSVELAPDEPLLRVNLAQAIIAEPGSDTDIAKSIRARGELEIALQKDEANPFAYHQMAITYAREGKEGMAALYTAEQHYHAGDIGGAATFATRANRHLEKNTPAWHRASDILNVARNHQRDARR